MLLPVVTAPLIGSWPVGAALAESPHWLPEAEMLLWVDILKPSFSILDPTTGENVETVLATKIGSACRTSTGGVLLALEREIWSRDAEGGMLRLAAPDIPGRHFNDGKCDPAGRFWVGSRSSDGSAGKGVLYRLDGAGELQEMDWGFDVCNGLGWSPDGSAFYLVDTVPRLLYRYDFDVRSGTPSGRRVIQDFAGVPGKPDGLAVDGAGRIYCAMWDGAGILVMSGVGERLGWLETPCPRPTSCAFGGADGRTLYVTSASFGLDPANAESFGLSGSILAFKASDVDVRPRLPGTAPYVEFGEASRVGSIPMRVNLVDRAKKSDC